MTRPPHKLYYNGRVLAAHGRFERSSLLVAGGQIVEVIPHGPDRELLQSGRVEGIDVCGQYIIPGFVDAHVHLRALALKDVRCDLGGARSLRELIDTLARFAVDGCGDGAVVGVEWDESGWEDASFPTRVQLDAVSTTRPVYARRICGHVGVVNTAFLRTLEAPARFVDPDTGLLTEAAVEVANHLSAPPPQTVSDSMEGAIRTLHALGITAIHDIVTPGGIDAYLSGVRRSRVPLRIDALLAGSIDELMSLRERAADIHPDWFRAVGLKLFSDGSIGGRTAAMHEPYADADTRGELLLDAAEMRSTFRRCAGQGLVCATHAIGDRAVAEVLAALDGVDTSGRLFRIEHAEILGEPELEGIVKSGVVLAMQPNFVRSWGGEGGMYHRRLGSDRWSRANPFRTLESRGVDFVFSSDGMPPGPLFGLRGATHHPVPGESIGAMSALDRYTGHTRAAVKLAPGRPADFVALTGNPLVADTDSVDVDATWVGGVEVFHR